jgi:uncharacterized membrane protein YdfJ with MMPL/SSD domain
MNEHVVPFITPNFGSFVGLILAFGVLGAIVHYVQPYQIWRHLVGVASVGLTLWDRTITLPSLNLLQFRWPSRPSDAASRIPEDEESRGARSIGTIALRTYNSQHRS